MKESIICRFKIITEVWSYYLLEYKVCNTQIKFTKDIQSNYLGDIFFYFQDTLDIIFEMYNKSNVDFVDKIGLLQSIYIQQDFIEEFLYVFRCGIEKGDLKKDDNYSINRDIRNELVGHPIRKELYKESIDSPYKNRLLSSTIYTIEQQPRGITYVRYHRENNYKFEEITHQISDIINRHILFLKEYFDIIINRLKNILSLFLSKISNLYDLIDKKDFDTIIKLISLHFEAFFKSDFIYDEKQITDVYKKKDLHLRYKITIDKFYKDLKESLNGTKKAIDEILNPKSQDISPIIIKEVDYNSINHKTEIGTLKKEENYDYELGKLAAKRNNIDFSFYSSFLVDKFLENRILSEELENMRLNIDNEVEYYCSLNLIYDILSK